MGNTGSTPGASKPFPAVSEWSDFNDCHGYTLFFSQPTVDVHLIVIQSNNRSLAGPKRHNAKYCALVIRERIINELAAGTSRRAIARGLRISKNTVKAVAEEEWEKVEERKKRIAAQAERAAEKAWDRMNDKLDSPDDIPLNVLVPVAGVATDKLLALRGNLPPELHLHQHADIDVQALWRRIRELEVREREPTDASGHT